MKSSALFPVLYHIPALEGSMVILHGQHAAIYLFIFPLTVFEVLKRLAVCSL